MKVTNLMLDESLRSIYGKIGFLSYLLSRRWGIRFLNFVGNLTKGRKIKSIHCDERFIESLSGGPKIRVRIFRPLNQREKLPAMLYCHGGGFVVGNPEQYLDMYEKFIKKRPCLVIVPDYRKAMDNPYPAGFNDCYDTLLWARNNAEKLNIYNTRFMIAGHSAGGGLTAAITLKARDTQDIDIAFQMPIYPMIDDRQTESARDIDVHVWNTKTNNLAWNLYLKNIRNGGQNIPFYAAPARNNDYTNFPPTITFVGEYEPFKDETISYVEALKSAGVPLLFKLYRGCFHAFDVVGGDAEIALDAVNFTYDSFAEYYDRYVTNKK